MAELSSTTKEHAHKTPGPSASAERSASVSEHGPEVDVGTPEAGVIARHATLVGDPRLGSATGAQRLRLVQRLQRGYGNAYVTRLVQRAVAEPPVAAPATPQQDPKFVAVEQKIGQVAKQEKQHPPAKAKAAEAQAAAHGPPNDIASQAAEKQVDKMSQQKPGEFDKKAFIAAVKKAIDASAPKNLEEADDFKKSGKAGQVKSEVSGMVGKGKQDSEGPIKKTNTEAPDASSAKPKVVKPMGEEKPGAAPGDAGAAQAIPSPKSAAETSMAAGPAQVNQEMGQAGVTEEQLKNSNEPQFTDAVAAKQGAEEHSKTAPLEYKAAENQTLDKAGADAKGAAGTGLHGMHGDRMGVLGAVGGQKGGAKSKDEAKRAEVASKIETIFSQTKTEVTTILGGLDAKVNTAFDAGEKDARAQFETYVDQKMSKFKADRYGGFFGGAKWLKDKLMGMPSEVNAFYADGRNLYLKQMEGVISNVADIVGGELGKAKARIALGKQQVKEFVASQPKELQQVARDAEQQIGGKFDELEGEVNSKQDALVQTLADKYVAARGELDSRIDALKAENKGLVDKAIDAIGGVIKTIMQLKDMLLGVLARAANVIGDIIKDPIKFLGNLVSAIKMGLNQFGANIEKHLKAALMGWLFGTLGEAGIKLPESFDLKGILSLILQVLGLTYENVRAIAVKIAGEKVVAFVEGTVTFFTTLAKEGPAGLWQWIKDKIAELNLKEMVLGAIKDFVITKIITAGITWLISMLNPAAAFIKACKMIYDVIMFIVERGSQIMEFVNSVLDGIGAIVAGSLGSAATLVENSLAKVLPLAIAFLASLLGVGGIAEKIKDIIEKIRAPITKLITAVVGPILKPLKAMYAKGAKFVKGLAEKGKDALKKGVDKVKAKAKGLVGGSGKGKPGEPSPAAPGPISPIESSVSMSGAKHSLIVSGEPTPKVEVASNRDTLTHKIGKAIAEIQKTDPKPADADQHVIDLKQLEAKGKAVEELVERHKAAKTQAPVTAPEIAALVAGLSAYGAKYKASDVDVFASEGDDLRKHAGYTWMQGKGLAEPFEARIVNNISSFSKAKIKTILDMIVKYSGNPVFEAKVDRAVTTNRFWSPNDGFFWEIEDLKSIADVRYLDVPIGSKVIDVLTGAGMLIDQKYAVELDETDPANPKMKANVNGQVAAMRGAVGTAINGITVVGWEFHPKMPIEPKVLAVLVSLGIDSHFK